MQLSDARRAIMRLVARVKERKKEGREALNSRRIHSRMNTVDFAMMQRDRTCELWQLVKDIVGRIYLLYLN